MDLDKWIVVKVSFNYEEGKVFRFYPKGICAGDLDEENDVFKSDDGDILHSATRFFKCANEMGEDNCYFFPIKCFDLITKYSNNSDLNQALIEYFDKIKSYEYYCALSSKQGKTLCNFYSVYNDFSKRPLFLDWNKPFDDNEIMKSTKTNGFEFSRNDIISKIKKRVIGQDKQVETLVTAVLSNQKYGMYEGLKSNILIIGPTGSGKTEMCNSLAKLLNIPIIKKDATKYTTTGYVGKDVLDILYDLYIESGKNLEETQRGIVIIDEFDKLGIGTRDNSKIRTTDVQHELLGLLGNGIYDVVVDKKKVSIDTSRITFVLAGAFQNVLDSLNKPDKKPLGFESVQPLPKDVVIKREDLATKGGIEHELLRRLPVIIQMNKLYADTLKRILEESEISNLRVWSKALFEADNIQLVHNDEVLMAMAEKAYRIGGGASGLQTVVTDTLQNIRSEALDGTLCDCKVILGIDTVNEPSKYLVKKKGVKNYEFSGYDG